MEFSKEQFTILNNALNEILNGPEAIDKEEFHSRVGTTQEEALNLLEKLNTFLKK